MTESVTVSSRVSELQAESGERSFTLESEALTEHRQQRARAVQLRHPGAGRASPNGNARRGDRRRSSGFTVNGQRPNSNNMTIDGVANIDTGDNGGNMATTNIDAVAEFKILTNAYQAEYGRAVGGQIQVVTKSGTQRLPRLRLLVRPALGLERQHLDEQAQRAPPRWTPRRPETSRNDYGYTLGGPIFIPGSSTRTRRSCSSSGARSSSAARTRRPSAQTPRAHRARAARGLLAERRQQRQPVPVHPRLPRPGLPCTRRRHARLLPGRRRARPHPAEPPLRAGPRRPRHLPRRRTSRRAAAINFTSQDPNEHAAPRGPAAAGLPGHRQLALHRPLHEHEGEHPAGLRHDLGRQRQRPAPDAGAVPAPRHELHALGDRHPQPDDVARDRASGRAANSLDYELAEREAVPARRRASPGCRCSSRTPSQADYIRDFRFRGGRTGNAGQYQTDRGPFTNENITHDVIANLTKVWGSHSAKFGVYFQNSFKPQSIFASFNSQINFSDDANNPFDTGFGYANAATGVFNSYTQAYKFALPEWRYKNFEWYAPGQLEGRQQADARLRRALLLPDAAVGHDAAGLELPARPVRLATARPGSSGRCASAPLRARGANRRGMDPRAASARASAPTLGQHRRGPLHRPPGARLEPLQRRLPGRPGHRRPAAGRQRVQGLAARSASSTTSPARARRSSAAAAGIFYDRPQGNMVFDMIANAPGVLDSTLQWGRLQDLQPPARPATRTRRSSLNPTAFDFKPPQDLRSGTSAIQQQAAAELHLRPGLRGLEVDGPAPAGADQRGAARAPRSCPRTRIRRAPQRDAGRDRAADDLLRPFPGYGNIRMWDYSGYSNYHALQTGHQPPVRQRVHVLGLLRLEQGADASTTTTSRAGPAERRVTRRVRRLDYSLRDLRPAAQLRRSTSSTRRPKVASGVARRDRERLADLGRLPLDERPAVRASATRSRASAQREPHRQRRQPAARASCSRAIRARARAAIPYRQINTSCFAPPQPGSDGRRVGALLPAPPADQQPRPLALEDLRRSEEPAGSRCASTRSTRSTTRSSPASTPRSTSPSLTDPTITNLPYDASGNWSDTTASARSTAWRRRARCSSSPA